jgi:hypothetical protein
MKTRKPMIASAGPVEPRAPDSSSGLSQIALDGLCVHLPVRACRLPGVPRAPYKLPCDSTNEGSRAQPHEIDAMPSSVPLVVTKVMRFSQTMGATQ